MLRAHGNEHDCPGSLRCAIPTPSSFAPRPTTPTPSKRLLGALLISNAAYARVSEFLRAEHFGNAVHGRIFAAIGKLIERGQIANPVTLKNLFDQDGALTEIGGAQYLARLAGAAVTIINAEDYGRIIHDLYLRRELITLGEDVVNDAFRQDLDDPAREQIERAEKRLFDLATDGQIEGGFRAFGGGADERHQQCRGSVQTQRQDGRRRDRVSSISTRSSAGCTRPIWSSSPAGRRWERRRSPPTSRSTRRKAYKPMRALRRSHRRRGRGNRRLFFAGDVGGAARHPDSCRGDRGSRPTVSAGAMISHEDFDKFVQASHRLAALRLFIDDTPALTVSALRTRARRLMRQQGLGLIVVDYLQLLRPSVQVRALENRVQEISDITRGLKALAKELNVPVLALSQLSRAVEQREDKRPMLADLRESGSIEQDADVVMFIFREEYYQVARADPPTPTKPKTSSTSVTRSGKSEFDKVHGIGEIIIAKQRHGPIGTIKLRFDAQDDQVRRFRGTRPHAGDALIR